MNLSREDYDLLQQIYDRLTQMQAESQELRAILKQERETAELQQAQTMRSKPKQVENPDSCIKQKENDDRSGWVPKKKETDDSEAEEYHYVSLGNLVEQVADQKHEVSTVDSLTENPKMDVCDDDSELLMLTQDRFELVDIQNQNTGSEITQGCQFSYTRRARKNLGVRKILVKRRYHRARKKKSTKYISRPELAQVLKCYGMFRNSLCIDRLENRKAERAYSKGRRSMVDIGVKRGPYLFGYEFQSQDSIKPLTHEPLMMEEAHSDFMVQNKVLEDAGIPEQMCLSSKYNGKFGLGFILHGLLNPGSHDVIRMVKIERDSMGHNEFTKAGRELREGDIYAEHYGKRCQELSHFGGKKREKDREFQGTTRPNKRKEWDSILIDGLSYELEEMSKFKGCDEFSYFQQQSSQHAQMHKGNKRLLLQEGENESCGLINSNENGGFIMDLNVIRLKLLLCLGVDRNKLIEWLDVHKSENQSQENVRAKVSRQAKSTTGEFKLLLHHVLKTGELIFSCDMLALLLKLCIIIHLEDKVSFSEASKGINKGLVCDKENKKLRNMEDRDKKEKNRTSGYIMTVVLSGLRTLCFLQGAAKREAHRMLLVKDISHRTNNGSLPRILLEEEQLVNIIDAIF